VAVPVDHTSSDVERRVLRTVAGVHGAAGRQQTLKQLVLPGGDGEVERSAALLRDQRMWLHRLLVSMHGCAKPISDNSRHGRAAETKPQVA